MPAKPLIINNLRGRPLLELAPGPSGTAPDGSGIAPEWKFVTEQLNHTRFDKLTLKKFCMILIERFPGIRSYVIELMIGRTRKVGLGSISSILNMLAKEGKVVRVKDGDSFRYWGVE